MSKIRLKRIDRRRIGLSPGSVPLVAPVKNEISILPDFLNHYRCLGVTDLFFIDDNSDDGTLDFLLDQPDCRVFRSEGGFRQARYGIDWINEILNNFCTEHWCVVVDCDEFFYYEDCENVPLYRFCDTVSAKGSNTVYAGMIDMYPAGRFCKPANTFIGSIVEQMNFFDADYVFRPWPRRPWDPATAPFFLQVIGGPRLRLQSNLETEIRRGALHQTICNQVDRFVDYVPQDKLPLLAKLWPIELPAQQKRPLNYITSGFAYHNPHGNSNTCLAGTVAALVHYKFLGGLDRRLERRDILNQHYRRGLSYLQLQQAIDRFTSDSLMYSGSMRLQSSADLLSVGLIGPGIAELWKDCSLLRQVRTHRPINEHD